MFVATDGLPGVSGVMFFVGVSQHDFLVTLQRANAIVTDAPKSDMTGPLMDILQAAALSVYEMIMIRSDDTPVDDATSNTMTNQLSQHWPGVLLAANDAGLFTFCPPLFTVSQVQDILVEFEVCCSAPLYWLLVVYCVVVVSSFTVARCVDGIRPCFNDHRQKLGMALTEPSRPSTH
jgi:hypothetical protein